MSVGAAQISATAAGSLAGTTAAPQKIAKFERAKLIIDPGSELECFFNPTEYSISKTNSWESKKVTGTSFTAPTFGGGEPRTMELSLLFDSTFLPVKKSVKEATAELLDMMEVAGNKPAGTPTSSPPFVTFQWGGLIFKGACTSLTVGYKLFSVEGEPLRADVKLSLKQAEKPPAGQNPTTRANAGFGVHTVRDGDTLPSISYQAYGDATRWRIIAEANGLDNPLHLRRGSALSLPALES